MPRWIWILLAASLAALFWAGSRTPSLPAAQSLSGTSGFSCLTVPQASPAQPLQIKRPMQHRADMPISDALVARWKASRPTSR